MGTSAIITVEGTNRVYHLQCDGFPQAVIPMLRAAYDGTFKFDELFNEFKRLMSDGYEGINEDLSRSYVDHCYMILQDGRVVVDSLRLVKLT